MYRITLEYAAAHLVPNGYDTGDAFRTIDTDGLWGIVRIGKRFSAARVNPRDAALGYVALSSGDSKSSALESARKWSRLERAGKVRLDELARRAAWDAGDLASVDGNLKEYHRRGMGAAMFERSKS